MSNELKALRALIQNIGKEIPNIALPIMNTISYLGSVLCAISLLPINQNSLCYGSNDGGRTIKDDTHMDPELNKIVEIIAEKFHFAEHDVRDKNGKVHSLKFATDVEIHRNENHYFIIDMGRFFPSNDPYNPFLNLFRPEYLTTLDEKLRLSCDAFSGFGMLENEIHNEAALRVKKLYIRYIEDITTNLQLTIFYPMQLKKELHSLGINLRHMGIILKTLIRSRKSEIRQRDSSDHIDQTDEEIREKNKRKKSILGGSKSIFKKRRSAKSRRSFESYRPLGEEIMNGKRVERLRRMEDIVLMEVILRSCKTILMKKLRSVADNQIVPDLDEIEKETYLFHLMVTDKNSDFWTGQNIRQVINQKFDINLAKNQRKNILLKLHDKNHIQVLIDNIPRYCNYEGGLFLFEIENRVYTKSSIPEMDDRYLIEKILDSPKQWISYWNKFLAHGASSDVLFPLGIVCSQKPGDNKVFKDAIKVHRGKEARIIKLLNNQAVTYKSFGVPIFRDKIELTEYIYPTISSISFYSMTDKQTELITVLRNLREVNVSNSPNISVHSIMLLSELDHLDSLDISNCPQIDDNAVEKIVLLESLTSLNISKCRGITETGVNCLFNLNEGAKLLKLDISFLDLTDKCVEWMQNCSLTELNISNNCFSDITAKRIKFILSLTSLNISNNNFGNEGFRNLSNLNLSILDASNTLIRNDGIRYISNMTNLTSLSLGQCQRLSSIKLLTVETLKVLDISKTRIPIWELDSVPLLNIVKLNISGLEFHREADISFFTKFETLETLNFSHTNISDAGVSNLAKIPLTNLNLSHCREFGSSTTKNSISKMKYLTNLDLSYCNVKNGISSLSSLEGLVSLNLSYIRNISINFCEKLQSLEKLQLFGCETRSRHLKSLRYIPQLTELNMNGNDLTNEGIDYISCLTNLRRITVLQGLSDFLSLESQTTLVSLVLPSAVNLRDEALVRILVSNLNLTELDLTYCERITDNGLAVLTRLKNLNSLNLSYVSVNNPSGFEGLHQLTSLVVTNCNSMSYNLWISISVLPLRKIQADMNKTVTDDVLYLLSQNLDHLSSLNLQKTKISDRGITNSLESFRALEHLNLSQTKLSTNGLLKILTLDRLKGLDISGCEKLSSISPLMTLTNMVELKLSRCPIEDADMLFLSNFSKLTFLDISWTSLSKDTITSIIESTPRLTTLNIQGTITHSIENSNPSLTIYADNITDIL
eukprot:TRINITY_DN4327_c0_g1_i3.p1 TRINITY_DN4327_c0_g1~~TRINITY_DN4327_c0_g1_i3.p1  ORF type:complete len:1220 (+),score=201.80 TRINITY_DN4327_c0_g1_i3:899-4558(+)